MPRGSTKAWLEKRRQKEGGEVARNGDTRGEVSADREARRRAAASAAADKDDKDDKDDDDDFTAVRAAVSRSGGAPPGAASRVEGSPSHSWKTSCRTGGCVWWQRGR